MATRSNYHLLTSLFFRHYCWFGWKLPKGLSFCCACAPLLPVVSGTLLNFLTLNNKFFFFFVPMAIHGSDPFVQVPDLATCTSVHDHLFCGGTLFIFLVHVPDLTALQLKNIREFFFLNVYYVFFLDHNFTAAFAFLPSSSSKYVRVQRHFHNIKSIPTNLLSILRKCPALIWLINIKNRRKRVSSFCLSRINEILINLKKISGRVRVLIKILSVFQSLKICKFNNLTLSLPWNQNPDSVVNGLTSLFKNSDGKGY